MNAYNSAARTKGDGTWRVGDVVEDLYEVCDEITAGAMGLVYRVHHQGWNIDLAVKTPRPELVSSPQRVTDFETEAQTWVELGLHPHVVACVYVRRLDGLPRVFAEWVDGGSLHDAITDGRLYAGSAEEVLARILDVAIQFAWGLDYAHGRGLVHQDVKPRNVMVTADWTVKVTDFGLAKACAVAGDTAATAGGSVLAGFGGGYTPAYCSPEQATAAAMAETGGRPGPLTRATDVWSWAISVWEMFTGSPPVNRGQVAAEAFAAFREDPTVEDPVIPAMPDPMVDLLARCLDSDPATRPRRIGELADELADLYQRLVAVPYPRTKPEPAKLVADGLNNQALSMLDLGRVEDAEQLWQQALETDPQHLHTLYNYGLHRWRRGQITDGELVDRLEAMRAAYPSPDADRLLAQVHLERHDTAAARALLAGAAHHAPEDRDIVAALAAADNQPELAAPRALEGCQADWVAISADGRIALSQSRTDDTLRVWDVRTGQCRRALTGHTEPVWSEGLSADGRVAVSGSPDHTVRIWDVGTGECLRILSGHTDKVNRVALSADGCTVVSGSSDRTVRVWDVHTGQCLRVLTNAFDRQRIALSADGRIAIAGGHDGAVRVWNLLTGTCIHTLTGHTNQVRSVAVSADSRIAVSGGDDMTVRVWDVLAGRCLRTLVGHTRLVWSVALSADGRIALSGADSVRAWHVPSGRCLRTVSVELPDSVALSADGSLAIWTRYTATVQVWNVPLARSHRAEWSYVRQQGAEDLLIGAATVEAAARRGEELIAAGRGAAAATELQTARAVAGHRRDPRLVEMWRHLGRLGKRCGLQDAWAQHVLTGHTDKVRSVAVSADGRTAVSGGGWRDKTVRIWDVRTGVCRHTLTDHTHVIVSVAMNAAGSVALSSSMDNTVRVWDVSTGACLRTLSGNFNEAPVAVSADGSIAVSGGRDSLVRVWDLRRGECVQTLTGHTDWVETVALTADGRVAISGSGGRDATRVWDVRSGACLHTFLEAGAVRSVAISADGRTLVSGSNDNTVQVWDLVRGTRRHAMDGHTGGARAVALTADGRIAISGGDDRNMRIWDLAAGRCLATLTGHTGELCSAALSADGHIALTGSEDTTVRVWALDWEYEFGADDSGGAARFGRMNG